MQTTTKIMPGSIFRIDYSFETDELRDDVHRILSGIRMPGFRPGHVPASLLERYYGTGFAYARAAEKIVGDTYKDVLKENDIIQIENGSISAEPHKKGEPIVVHYDFYFESKPEIEQYKEFKLIAPKSEVSDEAVESAIQKELRKQTARTPVTDRPCNNGDMVVVSYVGTIDGVAFEGGTSESATIELGRNNYLQELENGIVGMTIGEERDVPVRFPDNYGTDAIKGKNAVFHVTLKGITEITVPELDDDFVQDVSEYDTVEEYRAYIRSQIEADVAAQDKMYLNNRIVQEIMNHTKIEVPKPYVDRQILSLIEEQKAQYKMYGMDFEEVVKQEGSTMADIAKLLEPRANRQVAEYLVIKELIAREHLELTDEDLREYIIRSNPANASKVDDTIANLKNDALSAVRNDAMMDKLFAMIADTCEITYVAPDDPALKPAEDESAQAEPAAESQPAESAASEISEAQPEEPAAEAETPEDGKE